MAIDIRGDRTCDLPVTSLLLGELLLNHGAALPLKETLAVDAAIHICPHVTLFFSAFTLVFFFFFFHNSYIFLGDLSQSRGDVANSPVNRLCFFSISLSEIKLCTEINGLKLVLFVRLAPGMKSVPFFLLCQGWSGSAGTARRETEDLANTSPFHPHRSVV